MAVFALRNAAQIFKQNLGEDRKTRGGWKKNGVKTFVNKLKSANHLAAASPSLLAFPIGTCPDWHCEPPCRKGFNFFKSKFALQNLGSPLLPIPIASGQGPNFWMKAQVRKIKTLFHRKKNRPASANFFLQA